VGEYDHVAQRQQRERERLIGGEGVSGHRVPL